MNLDLYRYPGEKVQKSTLPAMAYKQQNSNVTGARNPQQQQQGPTPVAASIFDRLDVIETSFHLIISRFYRFCNNGFEIATHQCS